MAIEKTIEQDKIEVVGQYKAIQVRVASVIKEDVLHPDADISGETAEVQAICNAVWTDAVKAAWTEFQAAQPA